MFVERDEAAIGNFIEDVAKPRVYSGSRRRIVQKTSSKRRPPMPN
jgi:hypothetical protein